MFTTVRAQGQPLITRGVFDDIDAFAAATADWDLDFRQLQAGRPSMQLEVVVGQRILLHRLSFSHAIHQCGEPPGGFITLGLPDRADELKWANRNSSEAMMLDFNNPSGFDGVSGAGFAGITVSVAEDVLASTSEQLGLPKTAFIGSGLALRYAAEKPPLKAFHHYLYSLYKRLFEAQERQGLRWLIPVLDEIPVRLLISLEDSQQRWYDQPLWIRQKGLRRAVAFIEENGHDTPSIPQLCIACGLSWRSLDRAFKEYFGVGPKRYLLYFRLNRVRQQLKAASADSNVIDLANDWGFWHMGDFAREYRKLFGEYPSATLRGT